MIKIRTAVLHNGVDGSVAYANSIKEQLINECVVVNAFTDEPMKNVLPIRAVPNVMVCLFCEGLEEYQDVVDIINQLEYIKYQKENEAIGELLTDEQAMENPTIYPLWSPNSVEYKVDDRRRDNDRLFKCLQPHSSQEGWNPSATPALWVEIAAPGEYREIKEGILSTEAFAKDEIGWYQTKNNLWKSLIDNNVWTPDTYPAGWEQVNE